MLCPQTRRQTANPIPNHCLCHLHFCKNIGAEWDYVEHKSGNEMGNGGGDGMKLGD